MNTTPAHISVCVCTYQRPDLLKRLLIHLGQQDTGGRFTYSIVVADNDRLQSAQPVVADFALSSPIPVRYCVEPRQGIAMARNKAVANAEGDFAAFIDDDEFPEKDWLSKLLTACEEYGVDGVLGPVKRHFDEQPPRWLQKSHLYDRRVNATGTNVYWQEARTGNVLLKRKVLEGAEAPFREQFRIGEDQDFFRRKMEQGYRFIWSADAVAYETVPRARWKRRYILRKALMRGADARLQPSCDTRSILKSMVAVPLYLIALPFALFAGHHRFMTLLVSLFDHLGKLLALVGINPVTEQYVSG